MYESMVFLVPELSSLQHRNEMDIIKRFILHVRNLEVSSLTAR